MGASPWELHHESITTGWGGGYNKVRRMAGAVSAPGAFPPCTSGVFLARVRVNK